MDEKTTTRAADADEHPSGIYTNDEIAPAVADRTVDEGAPGEPDEGFAHVLDIEREDDAVVLTVEPLDGSIESIRLDGPTDARLDGKLRELFHSLGLEPGDEVGVRGELVPIVETDDGVALGDLGIAAGDSEASRAAGTPPSASGPVDRLRRIDPTLGFIEALLAGSVAIGLLVPLLVVAALAAIGVETGSMLGAILAQLCIAAALVLRSSVLDSD